MVSELKFAPPALIQGVIRGRAGPRDRADALADVCSLIISLGKTLKATRRIIMKKTLVVAMTVATVAIGTWFMQPVQPYHYELHHVTYGETMISIIEDANRNSDVNYDIREAVATSVAESAKMEGGATSRQIKPGDKIAVPIYK